MFVEANEARLFNYEPNLRDTRKDTWATAVLFCILLRWVLKWRWTNYAETTNIVAHYFFKIKNTESGSAGIKYSRDGNIRSQETLYALGIQLDYFHDTLIYCSRKLQLSLLFTTKQWTMSRHTRKTVLFFYVANCRQRKYFCAEDEVACEIREQVGIEKSESSACAPQLATFQSV